MQITLPYPPSANRYWRHNRGHIHRSNEAEKYIEGVAWMCKEAGAQPAAGDIVLYLTFYRPAKRGDLDNSLKVVIDALRTYAYHDDKQIVEIHAKRYDDKGDPRVEVVVSHALMGVS